MHNDNREKNWNVSMTDEEYAAAEARRLSTGLKRAEYSRIALRSATVISRLNSEDKQQVKQLLRLHEDINEILKILHSIQKNDPQKGEDSVRKYMNKPDILNKLEEYEQVIADAANYVASHINW